MLETCVGCGASFEKIDGPVHEYMHSSPACFAAFNTLLVEEYSSPALKDVHRFTVDTWAVQHPGSKDERRAIQSVGLHLARLFLQVQSPRPPAETNAVMLDISRHKGTLKYLAPPQAFGVTVADVAPFAGSVSHAERVRRWAEATWCDWSAHHDYVRQWISDYSRYRLR